MTEQTTIVVIGSLKAKTCLCNVYSNVSLYYIVKQICMDLQQYLDFQSFAGVHSRRKEENWRAIKSTKSTGSKCFAETAKTNNATV